MKEKIKQYIENINQLGVDARYEDNYDKLRIKIESIITWCNMVIVVLNRIESEKNNGLLRKD